MVWVRPSSEEVKPVAAQGMGLEAGSWCIRPTNMSPAIQSSHWVTIRWGSRVWGSAPLPRRRVRGRSRGSLSPVVPGAAAGRRKAAPATPAAATVPPRVTSRRFQPVLPFFFCCSPCPVWAARPARQYHNIGARPAATRGPFETNERHGDECDEIFVGRGSWPGRAAFAGRYRPGRQSRAGLAAPAPLLLGGRTAPVPGLLLRRRGTPAHGTRAGRGAPVCHLWPAFLAGGHARRRFRRPGRPEPARGSAAAADPLRLHRRHAAVSGLLLRRRPADPGCPRPGAGAAGGLLRAAVLAGSGGAPSRRTGSGRPSQ